MRIEFPNLIPDLEGQELVDETLNGLRIYYQNLPGDPKDKAQTFKQAVKRIEREGIGASPYDPNSKWGKLDRLFGILQKSKLGKAIHG